MKIACHREGLLGACQVASVAVATRDIKPILRNLKAVAVEDRCTLMATDLELGIRIDVRGIRVDDPGEAILTIGRLIPILRESNDDELLIETSSEHCLVQGANMEFEMPSEDPSAFPDLPSFAEEKYHEIAAGQLREMIKRTQFAAASAEHSKFGATTGILFELEEDHVGLIATDGRRLARSTGKGTPFGGHSTKGQMPVVPSKAMSLLDRNLTEPDEVIKISIRPNEVLIKTERAMIYSRLVEGRFPNYRQVMPAHLPVKVPFTVGPLMSALRQAAIMTDDESKRVAFNFSSNKLTLQARGTETGRSKVQIPIDYDGKAIEISFDPKFVLDMLKVLEPDTALTLELKDSQTPALFKADADYAYVVVPLVTASASAT